MSFCGFQYAVGGKNPILRGNERHKKYAIASSNSQWLMMRCVDDFRPCSPAAYQSDVSIRTNVRSHYITESHFCPVVP